MSILPEISIIIPAFNEENRLPKYLDSILGYFDTNKYYYEILVVDDGSTDSTAEVVESYSAKRSNIKLIKLAQNSGKGYAVKVGMLQAVGKLRLFADADGATPITELEKLKNAIDKGADVAIASRALNDNSCIVSAHFHRKFIGAIFNFIARLLTVRGIHDTQCGFKLFTEAAAKSVFSLQRINGFGFDVELLFIAHTNKYIISEIAVNWSDIPMSKVSVFKDSIKMLIDVVKIRLNKIRGVYGSD